MIYFIDDITILKIMFNNIIGQDNLIKLFEIEISKNSLNNSIIFHGPKYSGKLTTALELTRILNCEKNKDNNCNCNNCTRIREINFEGLIFLSRRNYYFLLNEFINSYKKNNKIFFLDNIIKIIKLISLPLQDFLIQNTFNESEKREFSINLEKLSEIIFKDKINPNELDAVLEIIKNMNTLYKTLNIPIDIIRNMLNWTYISLPGINRVVIIDHVDYLEKSSQNILLKRIEEPSPNLFFILIAENKNNIAKTILSRCRCYYFKRISEEDTKKIIYLNFNEKQNYKTLEDFLLRDFEISKENIIPVIIKLINLTFSKEVPISEISLFLNSFKDKNYVKKMLFEINCIIEREILRRDAGFVKESEVEILAKISYYNLKMINNLIFDKYKKIDLFNLNPILVLEGIFYPLKAMAQND